MFFEQSTIVAFVVTSLVTLTAAAPHAHHDHAQPRLTKRNSLMDRWFQDPNGETAQLFKRATTTATVGSPGKPFIHPSSVQH